MVNHHVTLSVFHVGPHIWNALPPDIYFLASLASFKVKLKSHLREDANSRSHLMLMPSFGVYLYLVDTQLFAAYLFH